MLADQTNCVGETAITIVLSNIAPPYQSHDLGVCKRCGGCFGPRSCSFRNRG